MVEKQIFWAELQVAKSKFRGTADSGCDARWKKASSEDQFSQKIRYCRVPQVPQRVDEVWDNDQTL